MSRRSSRLRSCGYYKSEEESEAGPLTNISYTETPIRVLKKTHHRTSKANKNDIPAPSVTEDLGPSADSSQTAPTERTSHVSAVISAQRSQTLSPALSGIHKGYFPEICRNSPNVRVFHREQREHSPDSADYLSSQGPRRPIVDFAGHIDWNHNTKYRNRINSFFSTLKTEVLHSSWKKIGCGLILVLIPLLLWVLLPWLTSDPSPLPYTNVPIKEEQPALTDRGTDLNDMQLEPILNKLQLLQEELQMQREFLSKMSEEVQQDFQVLNARINSVESNSQLHLKQELAVFQQQLLHFQQNDDSAADLSLRIQELEAQNAKLTALISSPAQLFTPELLHFMEKWFSDRIKEQDAARLVDNGSNTECGCPMAEKMADFALESQGASVISTRCSETYRTHSACMYLFGIPLWYPTESPRTVIQGAPVLPGRCWAFHGVQGTLVISLSHPIRISHVTLDHLPRSNSPTGDINSAPKDFEVYGMKTEAEEGTLLGTFTFDHNGLPTQTFRLPNPSDDVYQFVELRVLSNWGNMEYTCLYRFRVHGKISSN